MKCTRCDAAYLIPAGAIQTLANFAAPPVRPEARSTRLGLAKRERRALGQAEAFGLTRGEHHA